MNDRLSTVLELSGFAVMVFAAAMWSVWAAVMVVGLTVMLVGSAVGER